MGVMARSAPSSADQELIRLLAEEEVTVTAGQLERWRSHGLLPKAHVIRERGQGSRVLSHPEPVFRAAALLGEVSKRGVPWQLTAAHLVFAGHVISLECLRESAVWWIRRGQLGLVSRLWADDLAGLDP